MAKRWITAADAARLLGEQEADVRRLAREGLVGIFRDSARGDWFRRDDVVALAKLSIIPVRRAEG